MEKKDKSQKRKRVVLGVVCVLLAVVVIAMVGGTALADTILNGVNYVEKGKDATVSYEEALALLASEEAEQTETEDEEEDPTEESTEEPTEETTEEPTDTVPIEDETLGLEDTEAVGDEDHITNILLIGQDSLQGKRERSDTMMLVTVNTEKNTIIMTSFMRDMYVQIPGFFKEKLNAAYLLGGMDLLNETLYQNFGVVVDHNVEVSFDQFTNILEYLGGIDIEITAKEADFINKAMGKGAVQLEAGMNHLNSHRALAYARYRDKTTGDFGRTERQRKTLNALIEKYKSADLPTMIGMVNELMGMITTNMTKTEILGYAVKYFPMLTSAEIVSQRVPFDGKHTNNKDYYYMAMIDGKSVVVPRLTENAEKLAETLS